jgi:Fe2+ transport system protein FeoA
MLRKPTLLALPDLPKGRSAVVARVDEAPAELMEIGMVPGAHIRRTHSGLGGDPCVYELDDALVALRKVAARHIYVTLRDEGPERIG